MKILILENILPYPIDHGGVIRTWNFIKALSGKHEVSLLCLNTNRYRGTLAPLKKSLENIWVVEDIKKKKKAGIREKMRKLGNLLKMAPWETTETLSPQFERQLIKVFKEQDFDLILARFFVTARYLLSLAGKHRAKIVADLDNIDPIFINRKIALDSSINSYLKFRKKLNNYFLQVYFSQLRKFDKVLVCSKSDKQYLMKKNHLENIVVVPNTIEVDCRKNPAPPGSKKNLLFCGSLHYEPNIDGLLWFVREIFPLIKEDVPEVKFQIVGINPTKKVMGLVNNKDIFLFRNVPQVTPYYNSSSLVVVPLRYGGGTRIKIIEAFAYQRAIVTTSIGAEGLDLISGKHCLIKDDPISFAEACVSLLKDKNLGRKLVRNGSRLVNYQYSYLKISHQILSIFEEMIFYGNK